jgi:aspartyl-tRNA(Asn)/glutamyl-tRNA(Gln) amidotransferase subunit C
MNITNVETLTETAALAHLNLTETELTAAFPAFEQMLGFFAAMQAADNDAEAFAEPIAALAGETRQPPVDSGFFRADQTDSASEWARADSAEALIARAAERDGRFILIPNVL